MRDPHAMGKGGGYSLLEIGNQSNSVSVQNSDIPFICLA